MFVTFGIVGIHAEYIDAGFHTGITQIVLVYGDQAGYIGKGARCLGNHVSYRKIGKNYGCYQCRKFVYFVQQQCW